MQYNASNKIETMTGPTTARYVYGASGEKVATVVDGVTSYQFDPALEIVDGAVVLSYYFAGKRVARRVGSGPLELLVSDHLGSLRLVTTSTAETSRRLTYQPWGVATYVFGSSTEKYKYNGNAEDVPGLYDYNARTYTPKWGAMLQADAVVPSYGRPQSLNRYAYVENRPVVMVDPTGHYSSYAGSFGAPASVWSQAAADLAQVSGMPSLSLLMNEQAESPNESAILERSMQVLRFASIPDDVAIRIRNGQTIDQIIEDYRNRPALRAVANMINEIWMTHMTVNANAKSVNDMQEIAGTVGIREVDGQPVINVYGEGGRDTVSFGPPGPNKEGNLRVSIKMDIVAFRRDGATPLFVFHTHPGGSAPSDADWRGHSWWVRTYTAYPNGSHQYTPHIVILEHEYYWRSIRDDRWRGPAPR